MKKNQVEMKNRDNLIKNSVAGLNSSLDSSQRNRELKIELTNHPELCTEN